MNWRLKCLVFHLLRLPGGRALYRAKQRRDRFTVTPDYLWRHGMHVAAYKRVHPGRVLEFGGGAHFLTPLLLSKAGAEVLVYDIERLASIEQVNHTARQLGMKPVRDFAELEALHRIRYTAPGDVRATGLQNASIDMICTTSVLEHIPETALPLIQTECERIARPGAIFSHLIDYSDHYSHADAIPAFNFYRFTDKEWRKWNPPNHFQNRLRHMDFERLFYRLTTVEMQRWREAAALGPLANEFRGYTRDDLVTRVGHFVLSLR